jgi:hypothetical protein
MISVVTALAERLQLFDPEVFQKSQFVADVKPRILGNVYDLEDLEREAVRAILTYANPSAAPHSDAGRSEA